MPRPRGTAARRLTLASLSPTWSPGRLRGDRCASTPCVACLPGIRSTWLALFLACSRRHSTASAAPSATARSRCSIACSASSCTISSPARAERSGRRARPSDRRSRGAGPSGSGSPGRSREPAYRSGRRGMGFCQPCTTSTVGSRSGSPTPSSAAHARCLPQIRNPTHKPTCAGTCSPAWRST